MYMGITFNMASTLYKVNFPFFPSIVFVSMGTLHLTANLKCLAAFNTTE